MELGRTRSLLRQDLFHREVTPGDPAVGVGHPVGAVELDGSVRGVEEEAAAVRAVDPRGGHETTDPKGLSVGREAEGQATGRGAKDACVGVSHRYLHGS